MTTSSLRPAAGYVFLGICVRLGALQRVREGNLPQIMYCLILTRSILRRVPLLLGPLNALHSHKKADLADVTTLTVIMARM